MSLKMFHVVFVTLSVLLAFGCAVFAWQAAEQSQSALPRFIAVGAGVSGIGLIAYGVWFLKKTRKLIL
jgi:uncharacterized membrane protein SirB2